MKKTKKGFTLIELLIVIAIIGILASVVLVSLSSARVKAQVANFKSQAASLQAAAIIACDGSAGTTLVVADFTGLPTGLVLAGLPNGSCGTAGTGVFTFTATNTGVANCTATMTNTGTTFVGSGC